QHPDRRSRLRRRQAVGARTRGIEVRDGRIPRSEIHPPRRRPLEGKAVKGEEFKDDFRKALPKEVVQALTRRSPWTASGAVLHDVAVIAAAIAVALYFWPNPLVILVSVLVIGTRQHALFVIAHDAAHYLLYENRLLNDVVGRTCAMLQGLSMCTYRVIHRMHHNNLYRELDPDTALHGGYPRGRGYLVCKLLKDLYA